MSCNTSAGLLIYYYIKIAMNIIFIVTPIILLIMSTIDLLGAVTGDKDAFQKAWSNIFKRMIIAVVILILPSLINLTLSIVDMPSFGECLNKATKENIEKLEKEEEEKKKLSSQLLLEQKQAQTAKMMTIFDELKAKEEEEEARRKEETETPGDSGELIPRTYATSHDAAGMINVAKSQEGVTGGQPYWSWWGYTSRVAWCAIFVSWVANENGLLDGTIPKFQGCHAGMTWFREHNQWKNASYSPKPGDIIFFDWNGDGVANHVGIVEYVDGNKIHTIEGNSGDKVSRNARTTDNVIGYGIPNYK